MRLSGLSSGSRASSSAVQAVPADTSDVLKSTCSHSLSPSRRRSTLSPAARYLSMTQAAERLGLTVSQLSRAARAHELYAPAIRGMPLGANVPLGARLVRYHVEQVAIIERVLLGTTELETGLLEWKVFRQKGAR